MKDFLLSTDCNVDYFWRLVNSYFHHRYSYLCHRNGNPYEKIEFNLITYNSKKTAYTFQA